MPIPNLFPVIQKKETPEIIAKGQCKTISFLIIFFCLLIGLSVFYSVQQTVIETTVNNPTYSQYESFADYNPVCPCQDATEKLSTYANITMEQDIFCVSAHETYTACDNVGVCQNSSQNNIFMGISQLCNVSNELISQRIQSFKKTTYVTPNVVLKSEFEDTILSIAEENQRELAFTMVATTDGSEAMLAINSLISWDQIGVENTNDLNNTLYKFNDAHNCADDWDPSQCSIFYSVETTKISEVSNQSYWESFINELEDDTGVDTGITAAQLQYRTNYSSDWTIGELIREGFTMPVEVETDHSIHFNKCSPKTCTYTRNGTRSFAEILTAIAGLIGGIQAVLRGIFGALPTGEKSDTDAKPTDAANIEAPPAE